MTVGIVRLPKKPPQNLQEWDQLLRLLNRHIQHLDGRGLIVESRAENQRFLPLVSAANKNSLQSAQPLTAVDAGSNATINVASHSVQYGFGTVAYNAGSITGLAYSTLYYVYADDPDYEGGAVTYLATTNALLVTSSNGRYYLGNVTTPAAAGPPAGGGWGGGGGGGGSQIP